MRFNTSSVNPLKEILEYLPEEEIALTEPILRKCASILNKGGVICEKLTEVVTSLKLLEESGLIELDNSSPTKLRKIKWQSK